MKEANIIDVSSLPNVGVWGNFGLSILASIIASIIVIVGASFLSSKFRWFILAIFNTLVQGDIESIFPDARSAENTLMADLAKSEYVSIFAARGTELSRHTFESLFEKRKEKPSLKLRVLLPLTEIPEGQYDWIAQRSEEVENFDRGLGKVFRSQIDTNVETIQNRHHHGKFELRRYNVPAIGRIILTDYHVYFTPYQKDKYGMKSSMYQFKSGGSFYRSLLRFFDQVWEASAPPQEKALDPLQDDKNA